MLPAHGYDPDHAPSNISRLIFKIGGLRSDGSLMDKFGSVLEGMGINLEIVDSSEHQQPGSSSVKSSASAAANWIGNFSVSPRYDARRRRNSESAAPTVPIEDLRNFPTMLSSRARSASFGSRLDDQQLNFRPAVDENRPPRQAVLLQKGKATGLEHEDVAEQDRRPIPLRPLLVREDETDDGFPYRRHDAEEYPVSESDRADDYAPSDVYEGQVDHDYDLPGLQDVPDHYAGSSDTMAQTSDELPAEPVLTEEDEDLMEGDIQDFQNHVAHRKASAALSKWRSEARNTAQRHQHQGAQAVSYDKRFALTEAITLWRETAEAAKRERITSLGPIRDHDADAEMERRVDRGYSWVILSKAFAHWYRSSHDEVERTAIARRYILRRRYFLAWRSHQVDIETKIHTFRLGTLLRTWRRAAIHQEVRENVAVQKYRHDLARHVLTTWWDEYRAQLADEFRTYHLRMDCMRVWQGEIERIAASFQKALFEDERFLLGEAISTWMDRIEEFRVMEYGCTRRKMLVDLQRAVEEWRTRARLSKDLREFSDARNRRTKSQVIDKWVTEAAEANQKALLSRQLVQREFFAHWRNEAKLRRFQGQKRRALKLEIISHWRLEQKLVSYERLCERRTKQRVLAELSTAAAEAHAQAVRVLRTADIVAKRREKGSILRLWRRRMHGMLDWQDKAADRHYFSAASSHLEHWYERAGDEATRTAALEGYAARGAYYVATSNALRAWAESTKQARKERLTRSYHTFRRRYKVNLAATCVSKWRAATHDSHALSYDADNIYGAYLRDELGDCVQLWRNATNVMQVIREVAQTADQEVWWGKWSRRAKDLRETELDAADYANEQTLSRCWRTWEVAMLQNKGRQHVVATLQENNDRKLCRNILSQWSQKAGSGGANPDLRSSVASRRSVRYGNARGVNTPRFGSSVTPASPQPPAEHLPQIGEDLSDIYTATPRQQYGRASEPARNPFVSGPQELSQSLPQRPRGRSKHNSLPVAATPEPQGHIYPFPSSAGIPRTRSVHSSVHQQYQDTPHPPQQQPGPDFDEDEISFAPSEGNDYPPTFMSTPSRRAGTARLLSAGPSRTQPAPQPPFRRPATVAATTATTTTPSALLATPYERALRREYAGSGTLGSERRSAAGAGRMAATPRVTFADIREESGEGMYDGDDGS